MQPQQLLKKDDVLGKVLVFKTTSGCCLGFSFSLEEGQGRRKNQKQNLLDMQQIEYISIF